MAESARGIGARHGIVFGPGFRKEFGKTMKSLLVTGTFFFLLTHTVHSAEEKQAKVVNGVKEGDLATVTLTPSAEKRLAIKTEPIEEKSVLSSRLYGGELVLVDPAPEGGQSVFSLLPQMTSAERLRIAEEQVAADGILEAANVELAASEVVANRSDHGLLCPVIVAPECLRIRQGGFSFAFRNHFGRHDEGVARLLRVQAE